MHSDSYTFKSYAFGSKDDLPSSSSKLKIGSLKCNLRCLRFFTIYQYVFTGLIFFLCLVNTYKTGSWDPILEYMGFDNRATLSTVNDTSLEQFLRSIVSMDDANEEFYDIFKNETLNVAHNFSKMFRDFESSVKLDFREYSNAVAERIAINVSDAVKKYAQNFTEILAANHEADVSTWLTYGAKIYDLTNSSFAATNDSTIEKCDDCVKILLTVPKINATRLIRSRWLKPETLDDLN